MEMKSIIISVISCVLSALLDNLLSTVTNVNHTLQNEENLGGI